MNTPPLKTLDVKSWFRTVMPTCQHSAWLQSLALDHQLSRPKRFGLRLHLLLCKWCRRYGKQLRFLRQAAQQGPVSGESGLSIDARDRLKRALRQEGK